ncbi:hypothetical protein EDB19DRAFT_2027799 [Suillus lakei]|nr:hypothetical protein EDB19DRAFT_2027799 [Suillus lakei]
MPKLKNLDSIKRETCENEFDEACESSAAPEAQLTQEIVVPKVGRARADPVQGREGGEELHGKFGRPRIPLVNPYGYCDVELAVAPEAVFTTAVGHSSKWALASRHVTTLGEVVKHMLYLTGETPQVDEVKKYFALSYAAATVMRVAYGKTTPRLCLRLIPKSLRYAETSRGLVYFCALVYSIPWLKHLPGYGREFKQGFETYKTIYTSQLNRVNKQISHVDIGSSFAKFILENRDLYGLTETELAFLSSAGKCTVLMAAACFPEEQAKVQTEFDAVIGRHRVSAPERRPGIPSSPAGIHLRGFEMETLACQWGSSPNKRRRDMGNPSGKLLYSKLVALTVYPEPDAFKPQRWINEQGNLRDNLRLFFIYGFGQRVCPGQPIATRSVFINALFVLWAFRLTLDPTKPVPNVMEFMIGEIPDRPVCD